MKNPNPCQTCPRSGCAYKTAIGAPCPIPSPVALVEKTDKTNAGGVPMESPHLSPDAQAGLN